MASPVKAAALELGLPVTDRIDDVLDVDAELGVVVAYGRIIKPHILAELDMVNIHFSLLPRWRGAAPVERAILAGDSETGVGLMAVEEGLDTGGIYREVVVPIADSDTLDSLRDRLVDRGVDLLVEALSDGRSSLGEPTPQEGEPVYAEKLTPEDFRLDLGRPAVVLNRQIRVGRAWCEFRGKRFRIWEAGVEAVSADDQSPGLEPGQLDGIRLGTGEGVLELVTIQPEGKPRMDAAAWLNGAQPTSDERLA